MATTSEHLTIPVEVQSDHIKKITSSNPVQALSEIIWNALDSDATEVEVDFDTDFAGGIKEIEIRDNGLGMSKNEAHEGFKRLGGSWKNRTDKTRKLGRILHGREGKGRFRVFALGSPVIWKSIAFENGIKTSVNIEGNINRLQEFILSVEEVKKSVQLGTTVTIHNVKDFHDDLRDSKTRSRLIEILAPYLGNYPDVTINYDGRPLDLSSVTTKGPTHLEFERVTLNDGKKIDASLIIREWTFPNERRIAFCDSKGFSLCELPAGIRAPGFNFTAYLLSDYLKSRHDTGLLSTPDFHVQDEGISKLFETAKKALSDYFRDRELGKEAALINEWRESRIYPFKAKSTNPVEDVERQVFDIVAINVNKYLPGFEEMELKGKKFVLQCLRLALDSGEESARKIVGEVINLPKKKQKDLLELIDKTSLVAVIEASKEVADRLDFLAALRALLFQSDLRKVTKERSQLHKLLDTNIWVFGEHYNLTVSDQSLTEVLKRHEQLLGREHSGKKVTKPGGKRGIVDVMLSGRVSPSDLKRREHLIIELKAPKIPIRKKELDQIEEYAMAVSSDAAFGGTETEWDFWVIGDEVDDYVNKKRNISGLPSGVTFKNDESKVTVWVKEWGEIINACEVRLRFYQEQLNYQPTMENGLTHLAEKYAKYIPTSAVERVIDEEKRDNEVKEPG